MESALVTSLGQKHLLSQQIVLEQFKVSPNVLSPPDPLNTYCIKKRNLLNWACYYMFDESVALLMLKAGDPFLKSLINEEEMKKFYPLRLCH